MIFPIHTGPLSIESTCRTNLDKIVLYHLLKGVSRFYFRGEQKKCLGGGGQTKVQGGQNSVLPPGQNRQEEV